MLNVFRWKSRILVTLVGAAALSLIVVALILQHVKGVQACPLCVLQRYAFIALGLCCLAGGIFNVPRTGALAAWCAALAGTGIAGWQVWISRTPGLGCGIDPLENIVNHLITAKWLPTLFYAQGSCSDDAFRLFWLTIPQWSLLSFLAFGAALLWIALRRQRG